MNKDDIIFRLLIEAGEKGLSVNKITRHVFNATNTLFNEIDYESLHNSIQTYLYRNAKTSSSLFMKVGKRGVYCLNKNSKETQKRLLRFKDEAETPFESYSHEDEQILPFF